MSAPERVLGVTKSVVRTALPARVYGPIRARRVRRQVERYRSHVVHHCYGGFPLMVHLDDPLAEAWYDHDWEEPPEIAQLRAGRLRPGARVFDIGAHQAVVALMLARIVGAGGQVVAVEAEPHNAAVADANVAANGADNVTVLHAAGAGREGIVSFTESLNGVVAHRPGAPGAVAVAAVTVDGLAERFGAPDVVLIDVEGYEGHVLDGAARTLAAGVTDFMVELHDAAMLAAASSTAEQCVAHFRGGRFQLAIAADGDGPAVWRELRQDAVMDGRRCFLMARPVGAR
jgi:FkbM family methyltransferase